MSRARIAGKVTTTIYISKKLHTEIKLMAVRLGTSVSSMIEEAMEDKLKSMNYD